MTKHAYLIIAHTDPVCLQNLIDSIDDARNDIFILYDCKSNLYQFCSIKAKHSDIITPPQSQLIDIQWGKYSQIEAELYLFKTALKYNEKYGYFHLLSGQDMPLKSQDYIHSFCDNLPEGTNLVSVFPPEKSYPDAFSKTHYRYIFIDKFREPNAFKRKTYSAARRLYIFLQKILGLEKNYTGPTLRKGHQWVSLTKSAVEFVISKEEDIHTWFAGTFCPDELFIPTLLCSSEQFAHTLHPDGCMRKINWKNGKLYPYTLADFAKLKESPALFARKFDSRIDARIIHAIRKLNSRHFDIDTKQD